MDSSRMWATVYRPGDDLPPEVGPLGSSPLAKGCNAIANSAAAQPQGGRRGHGHRGFAGYVSDMLSHGRGRGGRGSAGGITARHPALGTKASDRDSPPKRLSPTWPKETADQLQRKLASSKEWLAF